VLKNIWITPNVHDSVSITLESDCHMGQLCIREMGFPDKETKNPRHTINISYFTPEDINKMAKYLDIIRTDM